MTDHADQRPDAVFEPWVPPPGTRVRIRVSAECQAGHQWLSGATGVVVEAIWSAALGPTPRTGDPDIDGYLGHWYWVELDLPVEHPSEHHLIRAELFAAAELEEER